MTQFINIGNRLIKTEHIVEARFLSDNVSWSLFPSNRFGTRLAETIHFPFCEIHLASGEVIAVKVRLRPPQIGESEVNWRFNHQDMINTWWDMFRETLGFDVENEDYDFLGEFSSSTSTERRNNDVVSA